MTLSHVGAVKFSRFFVSKGAAKASVSYSLDGRLDGRSSVTLYARKFSSGLEEILSDGYRNGLDISLDYFEKGTIFPFAHRQVVLFAGDPLYAAARAAAESAVAASAAAYAKTAERRAARSAGLLAEALADSSDVRLALVDELVDSGAEVAP